MIKHRLALIVSHPVQYYVPLYQQLAQRQDISIKVFFTWHDGSKPVHDSGFGIPVAWDIPLRQGYEFELVENVASDPGMHHFVGLRNPDLVRRVLNWNPTAVHITGWAWWSHFQALRTLAGKGIPILFRGDSHLLDDSMTGPRWWIKRIVLKHIYRWPSAFLVTGKANSDYYEAFGIDQKKLIPCPHSIDCHRFAEPAAQYEDAALRWRTELGIAEEQIVVLFAGKFEARKDPIGFMKAVESLKDNNVVAVMVGGGELQADVEAIASARPDLFRVLPFQNQRRMPVVYRLCDLFVLPSIWGETWGLAVNEALACSRPVLVSDKVGCAAEIVDGSCAYVFSRGGGPSLFDIMRALTADRTRLRNMRAAAAEKAGLFDVSVTEAALMNAISGLNPDE